MTLEEQETTVSVGKLDDEVQIWTSNPSDLRRLRKNPRVTEKAGGEDWGKFTVPKSAYDPMRGFKSQRKPLTEEQRQVLRERFAMIPCNTFERIRVTRRQSLNLAERYDQVFQRSSVAIAMLVDQGLKRLTSA